MCKGTINEFYVRLRKENIIMNNIEAIEILKKDMDRIITLNNGGNIEKEFDLFQAEALAIQALENE